MKKRTLTTLEEVWFFIYDECNNPILSNIKECNFMPQSFSERIADMVQQFKSGNIEEGLTLLKSIDVHKLNSEEKIDIIKIHLFLGHVEDAKDMLQQIKDQIQPIELNRLQAEIFYKEGDYDQALELMHQIISLDPTDDDYVFLSQLYFDEGLPEVAYRYINKAIEENKEIPFYYYQKGLYAFELGDFESAIEGFRQATELDGEEPLYFLALGEAEYSIGHFDEALHHYEEVLKRYPDQEEALYLKGMLLVQIGQISEGIKALKRVAELQPENLEVLTSLADAYEREHEHEQALQKLEKILSIDEYFLPALKRIGKIYLHQEEWEKAKEILYKALEIDPDDLNLHLMYAKIIKAYGDVKEAIQQYEMIYHEFSDEEICHDLGDLYFKNGEIEKAIECYEKQIEIEPDPKILTQLAACYAETKQYNKALSMMEQSLAIDPTQVQLNMIKEQLLQLLKDQE